MKILHLPIEYIWFHKIRQKIKLEEYREIKPYWIKRLCWHEYRNLTPEEVVTETNNGILVVKERFFDIVRFTNGYGKGVPTIDVECKNIQVGLGNLTWGAKKDVEYFVISLGKILSKKNL